MVLQVEHCTKAPEGVNEAEAQSALCLLICDAPTSTAQGCVCPETEAQNPYVH